MRNRSILKYLSAGIVILFVALALSPTINANINKTVIEQEFDELTTEVYDLNWARQKNNEPKTNDIYFFLFAIGRVTNFTERKSGYSTPWYTVECVDVYCIKSLRDRPIIQHLTNKEEIVFDACDTIIFYGGYWTAQSEFMIMWFRPLFPLYLLLAVLIL